ncbi:MAG: class IV adenylate cyclase [Candidatus Aminicenantes bacterium]|nr:class IV adenylate cyclase [Candidatus Aminicenantes bacterium]
MLETEIKLKVNNLKEMREKLLSLGCQIERDFYREWNTLYDFADNRLEKSRQALRLRRIDKKAFLTYKGQPQKSRSFKIREEYESEIKNIRHFKKILKKLGLRPVFEYRKKRMLLRKGRVKICLDETPVGNYLELEGRRSDIVKIARLLGYTRKEFIKLDYVQMIKEKREKDYSSSSSKLSSSSSISRSSSSSSDSSSNSSSGSNSSSS